MRLLISLFIVGISYIGFSQTESTVSTNLFNVKQDYTTDWLAYVDHNDFKIEYKFISCYPTNALDAEKLIFRVTNKTSNTISLNWQIDLYYGQDQDCNTCPYPNEYFREVELLPNESKEGSCAEKTNQPLTLFSKFIDGDYKGSANSLYKFQLSDLTIISL
jgi:hypothetical protein